MEDEKKKKKFNWTEFIAILILAIAIAGVTFAVTWWFMDARVQEKQDASDQLQANLMTRIRQLEKKIDINEEADELTQKYKGIGFTLDYPKAWVYRVYSGSTNSLVAFATTTANLPAENSDQQAGISVTTAKTSAVAKDLTSDVDKASKETVTIGDNISATKWTLASGRPNDLGGEQKIVMYEVKLKDNTYIRIQNVADNNLAAFNDMIKSLKLS